MLIGDINARLVAITNEMQLSKGIYYSTVHKQFNMFRALCRSSSGTSTVLAATGLHTAIS